MISGNRRSCLYVPGDREKMLEKAASVAADVLILNLEDGVSAALKDEARENIVHALRALDFGGKEIVVRINSLVSEAGRRDLAAVIPNRPDGICLPKVENAADIRWADDAMTDLQARYGLVEGAVSIHGMIESAAGVLHAEEIARASPRMASLIFGSADYAADLRCSPGEHRGELMLALQLIVTAARACGVDAIDAPCFDIRNMALLCSEAEQARRLGYEGKSVLHPDQVQHVNRIFDVTPEEIAWAREVLRELELAEGRGRALSTLEGRLIDNPHRAHAERILRRSGLRDNKG